MYLMAEVNFSSAFIEKIRIDGSPSGIEFLRPIAIQCINKVKTIKEGFQRINCEMSPAVIEWCSIADTHFQIMAFWGIFRSNEMQTEKIIEKTKDVETIYFQNHLLANKIIDLKQGLEGRLGTLKPNFGFCNLESAKHTLSLIHESLEYQLKK